MTAEDTRQLLMAALLARSGGDADMPGGGPWVRDWDETFVFYEHQGQTFRSTYSLNEDETKAEIGEPEKVVAKTSYTAVETLQRAYADIIQEVSARATEIEEPRIAEIITVCQGLLSAEAEDADAVTGAIAEAETALAWLREQAVALTEDGEKFPAAAYAYAPDPEKSSTWKLRLWETPDKKTTRKQLGEAAAALSPGGLRGVKVTIADADIPAVKRTIRGEYTRLGVERDDMPRWVKEAEVRTLLRDWTPLTEATVDGKGIATIVVIRPGFNTAKERYYPAEMLAKNVEMFEGVKMFANHPTDREDEERPERDIRDWVANLVNPRIGKEGEIIAEAVIVEPWLKAKLAELSDKGLLEEMGISINAIGQGEEGEIEGVKTAIIEKIIAVRSVDFVTEPGAGGVVTMYETAGEHDVDLMSVDQLRERRPDLVDAIANEAKNLALQEARKMSDSEDRVKELEGDNATLTTERNTAQAALEEAEKEKARAEAKSVIDKAISEAELPDASKKRLTERFADAENSDEIEEAVKAEIAYIAELSESGKVKGMGPSKNGKGPSEEEMKESAKRFLGEDASDEKVAAYLAR